VVQRAYAEAAEEYGFLIAPCPPGDPKKKGRVESGVKYTLMLHKQRADDVIYVIILMSYMHIRLFGETHSQ